MPDATLSSEMDAFLTGGGFPGLTAAFDPAATSPVSYWTGDDLAGSDGDSITTIAQSAGSADSFTGTGTLKKGANGINGHAAILMDGSANKYATTTGGDALDGDFYIAVIVKHSTSTGIQNYVSWGDAANHQRRSFAYGESYSGNSLAFIGQLADIHPITATVSADTPYFLECWRVGTQITVSINGQIQFSENPPNGLESYSSTALLLGQNPSNSELFSGLVAEVYVRDTFSIPIQRNMQNRAASRYGISVTPTIFHLRNNGGTIEVSSLSETDDGSVVVLGPGGPVLTGGTQLDFSSSATCTVNGTFAALAFSGEHMLVNRWANQNTVSVWNKDPNGFGAVRFLHNDSGKEMGAIGFAYPGRGPWGADTTGSVFIECSNFDNTSYHGTFRLVQTQGTTPKLRFEMAENGDFVFYTRETGAIVLKLTESGHILMPNIDTDDPAIAGAIYAQDGVGPVSISGG